MRLQSRPGRPWPRPRVRLKIGAALPTSQKQREPRAAEPSAVTTCAVFLPAFVISTPRRRPARMPVLGASFFVGDAGVRANAAASAQVSAATARARPVRQSHRERKWSPARDLYRARAAAQAAWGARKGAVRRSQPARRTRAAAPDRAK